jgi:hypothetical protein
MTGLSNKQLAELTEAFSQGFAKEGEQFIVRRTVRKIGSRSILSIKVQNLSSFNIADAAKPARD